MNQKSIDTISKLLLEEDTEILKLNQIVADALKEEDLIVHTLKNPPEDVLTQGQKMSDKVARFGGSWAFIISFFIVLAIWIMFNAIAPVKEIFDPYPFILMNLVLSCLAAIQAPIIMMSQNRKEEKDRQRAENDYVVNLKAEIQIKALHQKIDVLMQEQLKVLNESQALQLELLQQLTKKANV
jgi:uncharacterized membrane protein